MIKGTKEELDLIAGTHRCPEHDKALVVAWHAGENSYVLRCGADHFPEEVTKQPSLAELHKQGVELPEPIQSNIKKAIAKRSPTTPSPPQAETFIGIPATDLETGELIPFEKLGALVTYGRHYGLDPARSHVALMHGKPYITIDGYLFHAHHEKIPYSLTGRPLKEDELKAQGYEPSDLGWYSKVTRHDTGGVFEGYGFVKRSELMEMSKRHPDQLRHPVVAEKPGNMVIKRADWQVLRRAFPIGEAPQEEEDTPC